MATTQSFFGDSITITNSTQTEVYVSPLPNTTSVLHSVYISNTDLSIDITVDIELERSSSFFFIGRGLPVPNGGTLVFDKPINFLPGDKLHVTSSLATGKLDVTISTLRIVVIP